MKKSKAIEIADRINSMADELLEFLYESGCVEGSAIHMIDDIKEASSDIEDYIKQLGGAE